ncbi:MAG: hypothetical protein K0S92_284, partial [Desertimonas sp.]|nr:hypothetical protein [Desertimonas sp.]
AEFKALLGSVVKLVTVTAEPVLRVAGVIDVGIDELTAAFAGNDW